MGKSAAEKLLNELRRVKSNKRCADCETTSRFGFSHVCVKYNIFVCPKCKSAHQAYSHRVKVCSIVSLVVRIDSGKISSRKIFS